MSKAKQVSLYTHRFEKKNLFTLYDRKGYYDLYVCKDCGLEGKRRGFNEYIEIERTNIMEIQKLNTNKTTILIEALIEHENGNKYWESFEVTALEKAKEEIQKEVDIFNRTRGTKRKLIKLKEKFT